MGAKQAFCLLNAETKPVEDAEEKSDNREDNQMEPGLQTHWKIGVQSFHAASLRSV